MDKYLPKLSHIMADLSGSFKLFSINVTSDGMCTCACCVCLCVRVGAGKRERGIDPGCDCYPDNTASQTTWISRNGLPLCTPFRINKDQVSANDFSAPVVH